MSGAIQPNLQAMEQMLGELYRNAAARALPAGTEWFDAHTHTGFNDPDGFTASVEQVLAGLDLAGHRQALVFSSADPAGYVEANDRVLAEAEASGGRLVALARLDPHDGAAAEAQRSMDNGAAGFKLHPRAEQFEMHEPAVEEVVAIAHERKLPIMIHAGRGIPALGEDTVVLARRYPGARMILAHAGISDLAWIWRDARELPNLFFDTAWWNVADLLAMYALVPPGNILYASDMPYGHPVLNGLSFLRCTEVVGLAPEVIAEMAGGQLRRLLAGEEPRDLGPAPGPSPIAPPPNSPRVLAHLTGAMSRVMGGADPREPLALARLACEVTRDDPEHPLLARISAMIAVAEAAVPDLPASLRLVVGPAVAGAMLAGTPSAPL